MTVTAPLPEAALPNPVQKHAAGRVIVIGNPNVGKTALFNLLTRESGRVGNYPGVTVDRHVGRLAGGEDSASVEVSDLPGTYSLSARSAEEQIAINAVLGFGKNPKPDLVVVVVDAGQLVRNLYLVLQLLELQVPCVIALNMVDEVADNPPNADAIARLLGVSVVSTNGRTGAGAPALASAIRAALEAPPKGKVEVSYPATLRGDVDRIADALPQSWHANVERDRALARWALTSVDENDELSEIGPELRSRVLDVRRSSPARDFDQEIIGARYAFLDAHASSLFARGIEKPPQRRFSERLDRVLIHPVWGFAVFLVIMMAMFQSLFTWADPAIHLIERAVTALQAFTAEQIPSGFLRDLVCQGVLGGVGNVIVFVPQIVLLFFFVGLLEDSGYMARVAYLMDRVMRGLGLHGRAFVPMLSGFACAIPAILATRTMERRRDRLLTMLVVPLMTCSARLPVYTLVIAALFPPSKAFGFVPVQGLLMVGMYLFATVVALLSAWVLGRTAVRGRKVPLILEMPPYRIPKLSATLRMMWEKVSSFLTEAGTVILGCTIALWVLLSYPKPTEADLSAPKAVAAEHSISESYAGRVGKALEPALEPLGFDWKIGVGLVGAFAAREVFISTMGLVYGVAADPEHATPLRDRMRAETRADGRPAYTPLAGLSLMVFFAIACQCMSTLATVRRETRTWKWPLFLFAYTGVLAWTASFVVYQGGRLLGF